MTGLKGQSYSAQGKLAPAKAALGSRHQNPARPEVARVSGRCRPASFHPGRAAVLFSPHFGLASSTRAEWGASAGSR
jgi:hypothetical protein